ncbi:copper transpport protein [Coemansia sp. RSA 1646]|nr:copper transpport protein [Coemansia sp. RSA 1646]KAJ1773090.1 copper transpport protein [Coemansia sp. RSA 1843]KAJ2086049.1 copper transpport protein [Coemansia sp. RSA 986]KAJ2211163.1 copper transpport protein [Coemansia sp. RSA 487]
MPGHGGHEGHGGGGDDSRPMCAMNMSLNWSTENVCVLFDFWRVNSTTSLVFTCAAVFMLGYFYECLRAKLRSWETRTASSGGTGALADATSTLIPRDTTSGTSIRWKRAIYYGLMVAYSYSLMLIFMTYNGYLIISVIGGAIAGHYSYSIDEPGAVRGANCH